MTPPNSIVLVVEDEPLIRMLAVDVLTEGGHEVLEAQSADEALKTLETRSDVRVLFTDVKMAGSMNGKRLAHVVRERWPRIKIVIASGYQSSTSDDLPEGVACIAKPYDLSRMSQAVRALLAA